MIRSLVIKNFRLFEKLEVAHFGRVNLITGANNAGKSCLLEAIELYSTSGALNTVRNQLIKRQEYFPSRTPGLIVEGESSDAEDRIKLCYDALSSLYSPRALLDPLNMFLEIGQNVDDERKIKIRLFNVGEKQWSGLFEREDIQLITKLLRNSGFEIQTKELHELASLMDYLPPSETLVYELYIGENRVRADLIVTDILERAGRLLRQSDFQYGRDKTLFIPTSGIAMRELSAFWDSIALTEETEVLISALQIIEANIKEIAFVSIPRKSSERYPKVALFGSNRPVPLGEMGEGVNRILGIMLIMLNAKNSIVLIDEIDGGLHYTVMLDMWKMVFRVSKELNCQVFCTTHSYDCIRAFQKAAELTNDKDIGLIRLYRDESGVRAIDYDAEEIDTIATSRLEVR